MDKGYNWSIFWNAGYRQDWHNGITFLENSPKMRWYSDDNFIWVPIKQIRTEDFDGEVFNLEVEEDNTYICNLVVVHNCEGGGFPGLTTATDFATARGKLALVVATELSGLTYYPEPDGKPNPENDYQCLRANAIFAEASSAALVGYDDDWRHPSIIDQESYTDSHYIDDLGYKWRHGRLMVVLSKRVPELAPVVVKPAVEAVLQRQDLKVADIGWWVVHAAGLLVLRNIQKALGIAEEKLELSMEVLRDYGNCSSATVGLIGKRLMSENIKRGDFVVVVTVGPGIRGGASILRFG
jgi:alkylresorcinol/alkylpyrone synthase